MTQASWLLLAIFLIVAALQMAMNWNRPGMNLGVAALFMVVPILLATGFGWLLFLAVRRSEPAANFGFCLVLVFAVGGRLFQISGVLPKGVSARNMFSQNTTRPETPPDGAASPRPVPGQTRTPLPLAPSAPSVRPAPSEPTQPAQHASPSGSSRRAPEARPSTDAAPTAVRGELEQLRLDIDGQIEEVLAGIEPVLAELNTQPRQTVRDLRARAEKLTAARELLAALATRLRNTTEEASSLVPADARSDAFSWAARYGAMPRAFAAESLIRLVDRGIEEAELLRDNTSKWRYDAQGKITSRELSFQSRVQSIRFHLDAELARRNRMMDDLRGRR
ncbi:MAG: hypothetical protein KF864_01200 [Phycisphaeraceae bacterium]|nr:hypothetical protein [Phycisphaeraceae bacterium]